MHQRSRICGSPIIIVPMSVDEDRVAEIGRLFEAKGWKLRLDEVNEG